jgi:ABC-type proline/glycine betaine transport system ATPase subunit
VSSLNTIVDYDRVLVLSYGLIDEFDTPANLLRNPNSHFTGMVNETGPVNAQLLRNIAFAKEAGRRVDIVKALGADHADEEGGATTGLLSASPDATSGASSSALTPEALRAEVSQVRWHDVAADEAEEH